MRVDNRVIIVLYVKVGRGRGQRRCPPQSRRLQRHRHPRINLQSRPQRTLHQHPFQPPQRNSQHHQQQLQQPQRTHAPTLSPRIHPRMASHPRKRRKVPSPLRQIKRREKTERPLTLQSLLRNGQLHLPQIKIRLLHVRTLPTTRKTPTHQIHTPQNKKQLSNTTPRNTLQQTLPTRRTQTTTQQPHTSTRQLHLHLGNRLLRHGQNHQHPLQPKRSQLILHPLHQIHRPHLHHLRRTVQR